MSKDIQFVATIKLDFTLVYFPIDRLMINVKVFEANYDSVKIKEAPAKLIPHWKVDL